MRKNGVEVGEGKKKSKAFVRYFCLFVCAVILLTSLLIGDDAGAYGEGRSAIFKNPVNPDYESNDNGVKTSFRVRALNNLSGEAEYGSNAMSLISVSDEDNKRSTIKELCGYPGYGYIQQPLFFVQI